MLAPLFATLKTLSTLALLFGHSLTNNATIFVVAEVGLHQNLLPARLFGVLVLQMTNHLAFVVFLDRLKLVDCPGQLEVCLHMIALVDMRESLLKLGQYRRIHACRGVDGLSLEGQGPRGRLNRQNRKLHVYSTFANSLCPHFFFEKNATYAN